MMYKCFDCERTFEDGEIVTVKENYGMEGPFYEKHDCCPYCGGAFDEAVFCDICGKDFTKDDGLYDGNRICEDCVRGHLTYKNFYDYATQNDHRDWNAADKLEEFMFNWFWEADFQFERSSYEIKLMLEKAYNEAVKSDFAERFLDLIRDFVFSDFDITDDFACWLSKHKERW